MDLPEALDHLDGHPGAPGRPAPDGGSGSSSALAGLLHVMGDPQLAYPVIAVAGSTGADLVARMIGAVLAESGLTAAVLVGSHLDVVNQRLLRNGEPVSDAELAEQLTGVDDIEGLADVRPTWTQVVAAAGLSWFAQVAADVVVVDVDALGPLEPTPPVVPVVVVVTSVPPDPGSGSGTGTGTAGSPGPSARWAPLVGPAAALVLGDADEAAWRTLQARQPASISQAGVDFAVDENLAAVGGRVVDLHTGNGTVEQIFVPVQGSAVADSVAVAVAAVEAFFDRAVDGEVVASGLAQLHAPGRFEVLGHGPLVVVDVAQDPAEAETVAATLAEDFDVSGRRVLVVGLVEGTDAAAMLETLGATDFDAVLVCTPPGPEAMAATSVASVATDLGVDAEVVDDPVGALDAALAMSTADDAIVVTGSRAMAGAARSHLGRPAPRDR